MQIRNIASSVLAIAFAFTCTAHAAAAPETAPGKSGKPLTAQQARMKGCNADAKAKSLKGDERRAFMSTCLKGGTNALTAHDADKAASPSTAQTRRKACSAQAKEKGLKGSERKAFVRDCASEGEVASAS